MLYISPLDCSFYLFLFCMQLAFNTHTLFLSFVFFFLGPLQTDTVAVTSAGTLQCDFIIHMMGPHSIDEVRLRVKKVLERCEQKQITTVSFPAVGTGKNYTIVCSFVKKKDVLF